ncbi:FBXW7 [Symbiodinium necroappetens]|uniref:FBXW7 protein n=1 Tax=Symbiodinium necroappetens TaxID=1628268 RepID=A0A812QCM8_9DINO|nr:FBXW7 [Symbiodinium necroappetens]
MESIDGWVPPLWSTAGSRVSFRRQARWVPFAPSPPAGSCKGAQQVYYSHGSGLVYAGIGKQVVAHSAATGQPRVTYEGHGGPVTCLVVTFCPHLQCDVLLSGSVDSTVKCWVLGPLSDTPEQSELACCVDPRDSALRLTGRQWCRKTCKELMVLRGHAGPVQQLLFLEGRLCSGSEDGVLKVWGEDGQLLCCLLRCSLEDHEDGITCMLCAASEDIITGSRDCTLKCWNVKSGKLIDTMYGHTDWVTCLLEVEDSLWSGSRDTTIKRWHPITHQLLTTLQGHSSGISILSYISESILSGSADRTITQWHPKLQTQLASIDGMGGVSCLVEVATGIFRLAARGPPRLLAKPRCPDSEADSKSEPYELRCRPLQWPSQWPRGEFNFDSAACGEAFNEGTCWISPKILEEHF